MTVREYIYALASHPDAPARYASAGRSLARFEADGFEEASPVMMPYGSVWVRKEVTSTEKEVTPDDASTAPRSGSPVRVARDLRNRARVTRRRPVAGELALLAALFIALGSIVTALACTRLAVERIAEEQRAGTRFAQVHPEAVKTIPALKKHRIHRRKK